MITHILNVVQSLVRETIKKISRSPKWDGVRKKFLKTHSSCSVCGSTTLLQVHHMVPFNIAPALELDVRNLITLYMSKNECHLAIGHGGSYTMYNPTVEMDAMDALAHPEDFSKIAARAKSRRKKNVAV